MSGELTNPVDARAVLREMEISVGDVADRTGLMPGTIGSVLSGRSKSPKTRAKIEDAIGEPIWCTWEEFLDRGWQKTLIGADPATLTANELRQLARKGAPTDREILRRFKRSNPRLYKKMTARLKRVLVHAVKYDPARRTKEAMLQDILDQQIRKPTKEQAEVMIAHVSGQLVERCKKCDWESVVAPDVAYAACPKCKSRRLVFVSASGGVTPVRLRKPYPRRRRGVARAVQKLFEEAAIGPKTRPIQSASG